MVLIQLAAALEMIVRLSQARPEDMAHLGQSDLLPLIRQWQEIAQHPGLEPNLWSPDQFTQFARDALRRVKAAARDLGVNRQGRAKDCIAALEDLVRYSGEWMYVGGWERRRARRQIQMAAEDVRDACRLTPA